MEFDTAPKELQELCLCGGGPMGKDHFHDVGKMVSPEPPKKETKPDEHGQGSLF